MQFGFRAGRGTSDVIFVLRQTKENNIERQKKIYHTFVNLEKAYNTAIRQLKDQWLGRRHRRTFEIQYRIAPVLSAKFTILLSS